MTTFVARRNVVRSHKVRLLPLQAREPVVRKGSLSLEPDGDGVRTLKLAGPMDGGLAGELAGALAAAGRDETVRAIVISLDAVSPDHAWAELEPEALRNCALPVVVSAGADLPVSACGLASSADFVVASETADERGRPAGAIPVQEGRQTAAAMELAAQIAKAPREALVLLKAHMRRDLPRLLRDLKPAELSLDLAPQAARFGEPRRLALKTPVMELDLHEDGVVVLTMNERDGRNMFTPAFMDGLEEAFARISELRETRVVVLTGHASYFACGGTADGLSELQRGEGRFTDRRIYSLPLTCPLPVIAAMQGARYRRGLVAWHVLRPGDLRGRRHLSQQLSVVRLHPRSRCHDDLPAPAPRSPRPGSAVHRARISRPGAGRAVARSCCDARTRCVARRAGRGTQACRTTAR
ncbi:enoyl-CoA hydratase-related protein [Roseibium salinum]|nr:enoyl-CoA hydratase-related protein [Roseibium salinum]